MGQLQLAGYELDNMHPHSFGLCPNGNVVIIDFAHMEKRLCEANCIENLRRRLLGEDASADVEYEDGDEKRKEGENRGDRPGKLMGTDFQNKRRKFAGSSEDE